MNQKIVNLRCLAIILIVLGHSIIIYDHTFDLLKTEVEMPVFETMKHWISFIQLKLFFSISGFLMYYRVSKWKDMPLKNVMSGYKGFIKNKILRLLFPYTFICFCWMNPVKILLGVPEYEFGIKLFLEQLVFMECGHLCFLPCLFFIFIISFPLFAIICNKVSWHLSVLIIILFIWYSCSMPHIMQLENVKYYFLFFYVGYLINYLQECSPPPRQDWFKENIIGSSIFYFILLCILIMVGIIIWMKTSIGFDVYLSVVILIGLYMFVPSKRLYIVDEISNKSYGIYLFHSPMIYITAYLCPNINPWLMLFLNFFAFGFVAYSISKLIMQSKYKYLIGS